MANRKKKKEYTPKQDLAIRRHAFLNTLEKTGSRGASARASGLSPKIIRRWVDNDEEFKEEVLAREELFSGRLEVMALRLALGKEKRAVLFKGRQTKIKDPKTGKMVDHFEAQHFPQVLLALLRANLPDKYQQDKLKIDGGLQIKEVKGVTTDDL